MPTSEDVPTTAATASGGSEMTRGMVALFAVACGISVANLYYAQPLLPLISRQFHIGSGRPTWS